MMNTIDETFIDQVLKDDINKFRRKLDLKPVKNIMSKWMHSPDQVLLAFPSWYAEEKSDWPANCVFTGFPITRSEESQSLSDEVREFLKAGKPLVFTAGSAMAHSKKFFAVAVEATSRLNSRAILVSNFKNVIPESLPANIMHTAYEPFDLLFKEAAVVIHHGGIGTSAQALSNGAPQLVVPFAHDQFDNAFRLKQHSVALSAKDISTSSWVALLQELLKNQNTKDRCLKYSDLINQAQPATSEAADAIEKLNQ